jgi:hypothetical protein
MRDALSLLTNKAHGSNELLQHKKDAIAEAEKSTQDKGEQRKETIVNPPPKMPLEKITPRKDKSALYSLRTTFMTQALCFLP